MMHDHGEGFQAFDTAKKEMACLKRTNSRYHREALARGTMYRFLASVFLTPPNRAFLERITDGNFLEELSILFSEKAVAGLKEIASTLHLAGDLASLTQEYMDLFAVPTGRYVTPFEDVYGEVAVDGKQERGPLLGRRAISVIRQYREAGAEMQGTCKELPTHIGVELSFMNFLCEREASAISSGKEDQVQEEPMAVRYRELQGRFLQEHLNRWFPLLSQSIQTNATSHLYKGLALITEEFLAQDTARLLYQNDSVRHRETRQCK